MLDQVGTLPKVNHVDDDDKNEINDSPLIL